MYSLKTALGTRLTFTDDFNESPVWCPDSDNIVFTRNLTDHHELRLKSVSGAGEEQILVKTTGNTLATAWSRDRRYVYYSGDVFGANGKAQGMVLDMEGGSHKAMAATQSQGNGLHE